MKRKSLIIYLTFSFTLWKKISFTKPQKCSSRKQVHMSMNTSSTYTEFCTWTTYSIAKRGILFSSNHSDSDRCQAQRKGGYTIIPEVEGCPLLSVSTATSPQNKKNLLCLMPRFLCALCCELYLLQSVRHFTGWEWSSSERKCLHQSNEGEPRKFPAGWGPTVTTAPSGSHIVINRGFKGRPQLRNSCRKFILLSEAMQWHTHLDRFAS